MSVLYTRQLRYLAELSESLENVSLPTDKDGFLGVKILIMDTEQDRVVGEALRDSKGNLRIELENLVE